MVNDATPQAEPVAADGFVLMPVKLTPEIRAVFERCESERDLTIEEAWEAMLAARPPVAQQGAAEAVPFQKRVDPWLMACFGETIARDKQERSHRFIEEALELVQACGCTASEAHQLVDYVYGRPVGERAQEVGGVMVTLAALCLAHGIDMHDAAEVELARIWTKVEAIRAKQAAKPKHSPLPIAAHVAAAQPVAQGLTDDQIEDCIDEATRLFKMRNRSPGGQQITSYDSWNHWFARAIERALSTTHPAQADEGDTKVSADEEGV
jgi:NTP pyrophosphatase (non-canonical NTP hydrolase)